MYYNGQAIKTTTSPLSTNNRVQVLLKVSGETMDCTVKFTQEYGILIVYQKQAHKMIMLGGMIQVNLFRKLIRYLDKV